MKKNIFGIVLCGVIVLGLATGCGSNSNKNLKEADVVSDLNEVVKNYRDQNKNDEFFVVGVDDMQQQLETYKSSYKLLGSSENEYTTKPSAPNELFRPVDMNYPLCTFKPNALIYNSDADKYYNVKYECDDKKVMPTFTEAKELK